jgi:hypothetical protein
MKKRKGEHVDTLVGAYRVLKDNERAVLIAFRKDHSKKRINEKLTILLTRKGYSKE